MKSLLIVAHGSRREGSNEEVRELARRIAGNPRCQFDEVTAAFLEIAEPSIPDGVEQCILRGAIEVVVFPYFLAAGRHVVDDIPEQVSPVQQKFPEVTVRIAEHLGKSLALPDIILESTLS